METKQFIQKHAEFLRPHSLGKLVEWKPEIVNEQKFNKIKVPTRWGN